MRLPTRRALRSAWPLLLVVSLAATACSKSKSSPNSPNPNPTLELNSGDLAGGGAGVYAHTFANAGVYSYHCARHTNMQGTVTVQAGEPMSAAVSIVSSLDTGFQPMNVTVAPGGTVTWTNNHTAVHTVTSN